MTILATRHPRTLAALAALAIATAIPVTAADLGAAARRASSPDPTVAAAAVAELRAAGPAGLQSLLATDPEPPERILDAVCAQRHCAASRLFWHTSLPAAQAEARRSGRPIISLRLLGRLDEELSCANSRFFRLLLYPDPEVAALLRDDVVLHWESVRPVPRVTVDFGDGRKLERTLTGNSIHLVLDDNGRVLDGIPGLHAPAAFRQALVRALALAATVRAAAEAQREALVSDWHRERQRATAALLRQQAARAGVVAVVADEDPGAPRAVRADRLAPTKSAVERPLLRAFFGLALPPRRDDPAWTALARGADVRLSPASWRLLRAQSPTVPAAALRQRFESTLALDTVRNEALLHATVHAWLAAAALPAVRPFTERVYADLFLTPTSDPWLGLAEPDVLAAVGPQEGAPVRH